MSRVKSDPFMKEGMVAKKAGFARQDNPYPEGTTCHLLWDDGWMGDVPSKGTICNRKGCYCHDAHSAARGA